VLVLFVLGVGAGMSDTKNNTVARKSTRASACALCAWCGGWDE